MNRHLSPLALALTALCGAGCSSSGAPPPAPPSAEMHSGVRPAPSKPPARPATTDLKQLGFSKQGTFQVDLPHRSLAVVERFDELAAEQGWVKKLPQKATDPGARKWISTGAPLGPTDAYDAAWEEPKTGRVAVLNLWHTADRKDLQHGTFEIFPKAQSPFTAP